ncbi:Short-chain dehydrogenase/reductase 3 [Anabarilius grahami]|uniref:Short-chain dehydrogenase/reductase 3 n=1 Tax=Anabarilius grahami TaxID=495550 RepID=A0A3N0XIG2_ANAGA|nr:Short-chain dehydrogenase/reductase 3 [Anabarilius grahami]
MDLKVLGCVVLLPIQILYYIVKATVCWVLPSRRRDLTGDVVLITGGGRGIGRHLAKEFAVRGAKKLILWGRTEKCLKEACEEIALMGTECHYFVCDVANREEVYKQAKVVREKVGDVTILVNNAAVVHGKSLLDSDDDALLKSQHINTMGQFWVKAGKMGKRKDLSEIDKGQIVMARRLGQSISKTAALVGCSRSAVVSIYQKWFREGTVVNRRQGHGRPRLIDARRERRLARVVRSNRRATVLPRWTTKAFLPRMLELQNGHVVCVNSILSLSPIPGAIDYCTSKASSLAFMESLTLGLLDCPGVGCTTLLPFHTNTEMFQGMRVRFPQLFPPLKPEVVAQRTVDAVRTNTAFVYLPWTMHALVILKSMLPQSALEEIHKFSGSYTCMNTFKGRT